MHERLRCWIITFLIKLKESLSTIKQGRGTTGGIIISEKEKKRSVDPLKGKCFRGDNENLPYKDEQTKAVVTTNEKTQQDKTKSILKSRTWPNTYLVGGASQVFVGPFSFYSKFPE